MAKNEQIVDLHSPDHAEAGSPASSGRWTRAVTILALSGTVVALLVVGRREDVASGIAPCLAAEVSAPLYTRTTTCRCVGESLRTYTWAAFTLFSTQDQVEASRRAIQNQCRAGAYQTNRPSS